MKTKVKTLRDHVKESYMNKYIKKRIKRYALSYVEKAVVSYIAFLAIKGTSFA